MDHPGRVGPLLDAGQATLVERMPFLRSGHGDPARRRVESRHLSRNRPHGHDERDPGEERTAHADDDAHTGHGGHETHGMSEVAGRPMAERAEDRDGLNLDRLHVSLGPALQDWPAGLILHCTLQGDVVQAARIGSIPIRTDRASFWNEPWLLAARGERVARGTAARRRCAARLDSLGRLLAVAGWADPAARARRLRDEALAGVPPGSFARELLRLVRRVERSRALRWLLADVGSVAAPLIDEAGGAGEASEIGGDAHDRLVRWLHEARRAVAGFDDAQPLGTGERPGLREGPRGVSSPTQAVLDLLPRLLLGAEFACARIIIASLDPDMDEAAVAPLGGGPDA
ncbi:hypothetical protein [Streptomyces pristinaespiralis]|uniref:hypothetical protein n=1 Tax=Streptomyces pristinaespiralis TaxID=38300 RepID=UPI0033E21EFD